MGAMPPAGRAVEGRPGKALVSAKAPRLGMFRKGRDEMIDLPRGRGDREILPGRVMCAQPSAGSAQMSHLTLRWLRT